MTYFTTFYLQTYVNNGLQAKTALFHTIIQRLNVLRRHCYSFTVELKCYNLCSKYPPFF